MKHIMYLFTLFSFFIASIIVQAQNNDTVAGQEPIVVPENIQSLVKQITIAENNENWEEYSILRGQIIEAWQQVNPEVAKLYRNMNDGTPDLTPDGMPASSPRININEPTESILFETPMQSEVLWGDDKMITGGKAYDISMDIARNDDIYVATIGRLDASSTEKDSVYIYKSTDGGLTWAQWSSVFASTQTFKQVEIMCFDGYPGSTGDSYLLLFIVFDSGWLRVGRTLTSSPSWAFYTIAGSANSGYPTDFAVDRNYPSTNYRAICLYDSANVVKSIRSEPTSYGTVWQDAVSLGLLGKDVDLCYGYNGATYASFNGFNSGNLYAFENLDSGDPASWGTQTTLATGATDTTRRVEIIASRETAPDNIVAALFEKQNGTTYGIYQVMRLSGGPWGSMAPWVTVLENKWPALYSRKVNGNQIFPGVFEQSETGNFPPRTIRYKGYSGSAWSNSVQVSDDGIDITGIQKPEVGELTGDVPVFAYSGANYVGVYFDNSSWSTTSVEDELTPVAFTLEQNYPNPFNPSTTIEYSIPQSSLVRLKVFNTIGQEVSELVNQELQIGNYEVTFDARNLPSGIYFYRLEAGNFVQTNKMILIK